MTQRVGRRQRRTPAQWRELIERQAVSGLSQEAFCDREGLGRSTFTRWKSRLESKIASGTEVPAASLFAELTAADAPPKAARGHSGTGWDIELELGDGLCLRIRRGVGC